MNVECIMVIFSLIWVPMHVIRSLEPRKVMKMPSGQFRKVFIQLLSKPVVKEAGLGGFSNKRRILYRTVGGISSFHTVHKIL